MAETCNTKKINLKSMIMNLNHLKDKHKYSLLELLQKYVKKNV